MPRGHISEAGFGEWTFGGHGGAEACVGIASAGGVASISVPLKLPPQLLLLAGIRDDAAGVVVKADPVQRGVEDFVVARLEAHDVVGRFADERFWITAFHGRFEKEDVVHGVVAGGGGAISSESVLG